MNRTVSTLVPIAMSLLGIILFRQTTATPTDTLKVTPKVLSDLHAFRQEPKFQDAGIYRAPSEAMRLDAAAHLNEMIDRLLGTIAAAPTKAHVLSEFRRTLTQFDRSDSQERDRICEYLERTMDILGIESSDGLLNNWRYGFDPTPKP